MRQILVLLGALVMVLAACGSTADVDTAIEAETAEETAEAVEATEAAEAVETAETEPSDDNADDEPAASEPEADDPAESDEPAQPDQAEVNESARSDLATSVASEEDPISALLGFDSFEDPSFLVNAQRQVDLLTAECMLGQGFTYTPQDLDAETFAFGRSIAPDLSDEEFAATYGYGITNDAQRQLDLANLTATDPNVAAVTAMSDSERDAWVFAMLGPGATVDIDTGDLLDTETGEVIEDPTQLIFAGTGCVSVANQEVFGSLQALFQLGPQFEELGDRFESDTRVVEITGEWTTCMAEAGFSYGSLDEPFTQIVTEANDIVLPVLATANQGLFTDAVEPLSFTDEQSAALDELMATEIEVASADVACIAPFEDELDDIQRGYALDFIDQNAGVLADVVN